MGTLISSGHIVAAGWMGNNGLFFEMLFEVYRNMSTKTASGTKYK